MNNFNNLFSKPTTSVLILGRTHGIASWKITAIRFHPISEYCCVRAFAFLCETAQIRWDCFMALSVYKCIRGMPPLYRSDYRRYGRVGKGVGHPCLKLRCAGGHEFELRPGQYSRMSFSSDQVTGTVFPHLKMPFLPNSEFI